MRRTFVLIFLALLVLQIFASGRIVKRQDDFDRPRNASERSQRCSTTDGIVGTCVPGGTCPRVSSAIPTSCPLASETNLTGTCCPDDDEEALASPGLAGSTPSVPAAAPSSNDEEKSREEIEMLLLERGLFVQPGSAEALHNAIVFADPVSQTLAKAVMPQSAPPQAFGFHFRTKSRPTCIEPQTFCGPRSKYRTYDGSCNNAAHGDWGKSHTAFQRLMPSTYADGLLKPRRSSNGTALPSARLVSTTVLRSQEIELTDVSFFFMAFGQFLDHDLTLTPTTRGANGTGILCCPPRITSDLRHPECMTIDVPADDPFYEPFGVSCLEFVRTIPAPRKVCAKDTDPREQINQLTSYIDASMIYGSDETQATKLRSKSGGKLLSGDGNSLPEFPPHSTGRGCPGGTQRRLCFIAGDVRSAEQPALVTIHIAFFREHNRIADELARLNPDWDDETLYRETRRIVGAVVQHVVYNEYLPVLLGNDTVRRYNSTLLRTGFWDDYDETRDASIYNEFATAAFRFAHSAVPGFMKLVDEKDDETTQVLRDHFLKPYDVDLFEDYTRGMLVQSCNAVDDAVTPDLTNHLFQTNGRFGLDLAALNIQRGRDHAIGTYVQARKFCGLEEVTSFRDLSKFMDSEVADSFEKIYESVEDIDLWIGGVVEKPLSGAVVGPTFACILAKQFQISRSGDWFWYERGNTSASFTEEQLCQIRRSSLARILCDNSNITKVQPRVLLMPSAWNRPVECDGDEIPRMSFCSWQNEPVPIEMEFDNPPL